MHFSAWFLPYCATLGLATWALLGLVAAQPLAEVAGWYTAQAPVRAAGGFLVGIATCFGLLWLKQDVPSTLSGTPAADLVATGLPTNPVHVLDFAFVVPGMLVTGVALWRRTAAGLLLGPMWMAFGVVMTTAIAVMMVGLARAGLAQSFGVAAVMGALIAAGTAVFLWLQRHVVP